MWFEGRRLHASSLLELATSHHRRNNEVSRAHYSHPRVAIDVLIHLFCTSVVKEINSINMKELEGNGGGSWHDTYKGQYNLLTQLFAYPGVGMACISPSFWRSSLGVRER